MPSPRRKQPRQESASAAEGTARPTIIHNEFFELVPIVENGKQDYLWCCKKCPWKGKKSAAYEHSKNARQGDPCPPIRQRAANRGRNYPQLEVAEEGPSDHGNIAVDEPVTQTSILTGFGLAVLDDAAEQWKAVPLAEAIASAEDDLKDLAEVSFWHQFVGLCFHRPESRGFSMSICVPFFSTSLDYHSISATKCIRWANCHLANYCV